MNWARSGSPGSRTVSAKSPGWALMCLVAMVKRGSAILHAMPRADVSGTRQRATIRRFWIRRGGPPILAASYRAPIPARPQRRSRGGDSLGSENRFVSAVGARLRPDARSRRAGSRTAQAQEGPARGGHRHRATPRGEHPGCADLGVGAVGRAHGRAVRGRRGHPGARDARSEPVRRVVERPACAALLHPRPRQHRLRPRGLAARVRSSWTRSSSRT